MPDEELWNGFFDPDRVLATLGIHAGMEDLVEFGCGYGTFTLAAARIVSGTVYALDIEAALVQGIEEKCRAAGISTVRTTERDFVAHGSGLASGVADGALLFNILHHEQPVELMKEALRVLKPWGLLAVCHWNHDPSTPRGPALEIRPRPEQCIAWGIEAGFHHDGTRYDLPPYHYGLVFRRPPV
jgi:SAM-dependent methyltransferase